jgi:LAS superfamily LD-carboxypeptidase LdcB
MCPEDFDKYMVLINPSNPVDETYIPEDLITVPNPRYDNGSSLCRDASMSLEALFLEMHTLGMRDMKVSVAYRTYEQQKKQFDTYTYNERYYYRSHYETEGKWFSDVAYNVLGKAYLEEKYISKGKTSLTADDAKRVAMSYSAYPGTGDHQTGLALDLYLPGNSGAKFAETDEYKWLCENAHKFGFIFRYPEDKVNITGYAFEPYHLRFVGQYHAALIYETGLSLEEYVAKYID